MEYLNQLLNPKRTCMWTFAGVVAHSFREHTNTIKSVAVHETTERVFLSASRDNTVKCWDLLMDASRQTYTGHRSAVSCVDFVDRGSLVASCDGSIHIWELERAMRVMQVEHSSSYLTFCGHQDGRVVVGATAASITFTDLRAPLEQCEWILPNNQSGQPKALCIHTVDTNLMAVAQTNGYVTLIDMRSGLLLYNWRAHDAPIIDLKPYGTSLISSSQDRTIAMWDITGCGTAGGSLMSTVSNSGNPRLVTNFKGHREPVISFDVYQDDLFTVSGHKLSIAALRGQGSVVKLERRRLLKSSLKPNHLTTINVLPWHQLAVVGTDDGQVKVVY
jgi:WD40 repeat protein